MIDDHQPFLGINQVKQVEHETCTTYNMHNIQHVQHTTSNMHHPETEPIDFYEIFYNNNFNGKQNKAI